MSGLREALTSYLSLRRGMGFKLDRDEKMTCIGLLGSLAAELEALLRCAVLDGAQDSDGGSLLRHRGCRWGLVAEPAGGVFVGGGTWPMTMQ